MTIEQKAALMALGHYAVFKTWEELEKEYSTAKDADGNYYIDCPGHFVRRMKSLCGKAVHFEEGPYMKMQYKGSPEFGWEINGWLITAEMLKPIFESDVTNETEFIKLGRDTRF